MALAYVTDYAPIASSHLRFPQLRAAGDNCRVSLRDRLRAAMEAKGYSARKLALDAKLADTTVSKFLNGSTRSITIENLEKCSAVLDVSMRHLMFGEPDTDNIVSIWQRIPKANREQAKAVLRTFERKDTA